MKQQPVRSSRSRPLAATTVAAFVAWLALGAAIAGWWWWSWQHRQSLQDVESAIESLYRLIGLPDGWWSTGDGALHLATALVATLWLGLGARLFVTRFHVAGPGLVVLAALIADEAAQERLPGRTASLGDIAWGMAGLLIGLALLLVASRLRSGTRGGRARTAHRLDSAGPRR